MPLTAVKYTFLEERLFYIRTQHSTLDEIKENIGVMAPKAAIKDVYDKAGGIFNCESLSEVPRDRWQAYNAKTRDHSMSNISSNKHKDLMHDLL